jgi:hypothetical protein
MTSTILRLLSTCCLVHNEPAKAHLREHMEQDPRSEATNRAQTFQIRHTTMSPSQSWLLQVSEECRYRHYDVGRLSNAPRLGAPATLTLSVTGRRTGSAEDQRFRAIALGANCALSSPLVQHLRSLCASAAGRPAQTHSGSDVLCWNDSQWESCRPIS